MQRHRRKAQVKAPVVAGHEVSLRELELAPLQQREAQLAADGVRRRVVNVRELSASIRLSVVSCLPVSPRIPDAARVLRLLVAGFIPEAEVELSEGLVEVWQRECEYGDQGGAFGLA